MKANKNNYWRNCFKQWFYQLEKTSPEEVNKIKRKIIIDTVLNLLRFEEEFADRLRLYINEQFFNANTLTKVFKLEDIDSDIFQYKNYHRIVDYAINYVEKYYGDWLDLIELNDNNTLTVAVASVVYV